MKRRKTIVADCVMRDVAELEEYQPGRHQPPIYTDGSYMYVACRNNEIPPTDRQWKFLEVWQDIDLKNGWRVAVETENE